MGIHHFFTSFNDLERIYRAPGRFKFEEHNVAAHSWKVSQYAMFFATVEEMHGATINWKTLYEKTVNHDYGEIFIGDIKTPVKHSSAELKNMIALVEEKMVEHFIEEEIPQEFKEVFKHRMAEGKDRSIEGILLELSDKLDQFYEAFAELKHGNTDIEFVKMYQIALKHILTIPLPHSVNYFKNTILKDVMTDHISQDIINLTQGILQEV
ncbi:MAG: HD domain-containing protein [Kurthia sp.]|nr:HD domain-containing protein [Candidatus Kurthia equi]